jgi:hypothetical protein
MRFAGKPVIRPLWQVWWRCYRAKRSNFSTPQWAQFSPARESRQLLVQIGGDLDAVVAGFAALFLAAGAGDMGVRLDLDLRKEP